MRSVSPGFAVISVLSYFTLSSPVISTSRGFVRISPWTSSSRSRSRLTGRKPARRSLRRAGPPADTQSWVRDFLSTGASVFSHAVYQALRSLMANPADPGWCRPAEVPPNTRPRRPRAPGSSRTSASRTTVPARSSARRVSGNGETPNSMPQVSARLFHGAAGRAWFSSQMPSQGKSARRHT